MPLAPAELWCGLSGFRKCGGRDERKGSYGADPPAGLREKGTVSPKASPTAQKHLVGDLASGKATCSATTLGTSHGLRPGGSWTWQPPAQPLDGADLSRAQPSLVGHWHPGSSPDHAASLSLQRPDWEEREGGSQHHCSKKQLATLLKSDLAHRFNSFSANQSRSKPAKHTVPRAAAACILSLLLAFTSLL